MSIFIDIVAICVFFGIRLKNKCHVFLGNIPDNLTWYGSITDLIQALTESTYWFIIKLNLIFDIYDP